LELRHAVQKAVRWPATGGIQRLTRGGTVGKANGTNDKKQIVGHVLSKRTYAKLWTLL
jgi:hypothetical protein